jgi:hypothetical protein
MRAAYYVAAGLSWLLFAAFVLLRAPVALGQTVTVTPSVVRIPAGQQPLDAWPDFESDPAAGRVTLTVTYVTGAAVAPGGGIMLGVGYPTSNLANAAFAADDGWMLGPTNAMSRFPLGQFQVANPAAPDYCTASSPAGALVLSRVIRTGLGRDVLLKVVAPVGLPAAATVTVTLGAGVGMAFSWTPGSPSVYVAEDLTASGSYHQTQAALPRLLFTGASADRFVVNGPVTAEVGAPFRMTIRAVQGADNAGGDAVLPVEDFDSIVSCFSSDPLFAIQGTLLSDRHFQRGVLSLTASFSTPGPQTVTFMAGDAWHQTVHSQRSMSNAVLVQPVGSAVEILCGDLHRHCAEGGHAAVTNDLAWQDLYDERQDFGCVVQHSETYMSGFANANAQASAFQGQHAPADFVCFPGYEFTLRGEHRNVFLQNVTTDPSISALPYLGFEAPPPVVKTTVQDLLMQLAAGTTSAMSMPHHSIWNGNGKGSDGAPFDWLYEWGAPADCPEQPLVEVFSCHGSSEVFLTSVSAPDDYPILNDLAEQRPADNLATVRDALALGMRFGIVANSDRHGYTNGCTANSEGFERTGLTFVRAAMTGGPRRWRIWNAMHHRHVYATTGARIALDWTCNSAEMGDELVSAAPTFHMEAHASGIGITSRPLFLKALVVRDGVVVATQPLSASDVDWSFTDPAPVADGAFHSYYVRVTQDDWHVAWSSPIWVEVP